MKEQDVDGWRRTHTARYREKILSENPAES